MKEKMGKIAGTETEGAEKKKSKTKMTKKNLAKKILVGILYSVEKLSDEMDAMRYQGAYLRGGSDLVAHLKNERERRYLQNEIQRLKRQKFIKEREVGNRLELYLTEKGEQAALRYKIINSNKKLRNKYYIVIFDIPESERRIRDFFRKFIKEAGFVKLQQSVWLTEKDILEPLIKLIHVTESEKWIQIITATAISGWGNNDNRKCA